MPYLLDTDWAINALANRRHAMVTIDRLALEGIAVSWLTLGELYEGAFGFDDPAAHLSTLRAFIQPFPILGLNDSIMERFAEIRSTLRRRGNLIADFDILLGATALHHGLTILTYNLRHFERIPGLQLYRE